MTDSSCGSLPGGAGRAADAPGECRPAASQNASAERLQVFVTLPDAEAARGLGRELVRAGLAACVQIIGPIESIYRWQGRVEEAREWLCLAKTDRRTYPELERAIIAGHPYEVPEIIAVPIVAGSGRYLDWLDAALASRTGR